MASRNKIYKNFKENLKKIKQMTIKKSKYIKTLKKFIPSNAIKNDK